MLTWRTFFERRNNGISKSAMFLWIYHVRRKLVWKTIFNYIILHHAIPQRWFYLFRKKNIPKLNLGRYKRWWMFRKEFFFMKRKGNYVYSLHLKMIISRKTYEKIVPETTTIITTSIMPYNDFFFHSNFFHFFTELFLRYYYSNSQSWKFFHFSRSSISTDVARKMEKEDDEWLKMH